MDGVVQQITGLLLLCIPFSNAIKCGRYICTGAGVYCCDDDDYDDGDVDDDHCCWESYVYNLWWFWLILVVTFLLILGCGLACWRRRRAQYRYSIMATSEYPAYGTVVQGSTMTATYNANPGLNPSYGSAPVVYPNAPAAPPSYDTAMRPPPEYK